MATQTNSGMSSAELALLADRKRAEIFATKHDLSERLTISNVASEVTDAGAEALKSAGEAAIERPVASGAIILSVAALGVAWMTGAVGGSKDTDSSKPGGTSRHSRQQNDGEQGDLWPSDQSAPRAADASAAADTSRTNSRRLNGKSGSQTAFASLIDDILHIVPRLGTALAAGYLAEKFIPRGKGEDSIWDEVRGQMDKSVRSGALNLVHRFGMSRSNPLPLLTIAAVALRALTGESKPSAQGR